MGIRDKIRDILYRKKPQLSAKELSSDDIFRAEVLNYVHQEYKRREQESVFIRLQAQINAAFLAGRQTVWINPVSQRIEPEEEFLENKVYNQILPIIETKKAILSSLKNNVKVAPASSGPVDIAAASMSNKIIRATRRRMNLTEIVTRGILVGLITGTAIYKTVWSSDAGRVVGISNEEFSDEELNELGGPPMEAGVTIERKSKVLREGDVDTELCSIHEIYPHTIAKPISEQPSVMHVRVMTVKDVEAKWGILEAGSDQYVIAASPTEIGIMARDIAIANALGGEKVSDATKVYELWERPSGMYPHGRLIITTEKNVLHYGPLPYKLGEWGEYDLPFTVQHSILTDGFFGKSIISDLIDPQRVYNNTRNLLTDYTNRVTVGVWVAEEGSLTGDAAAVLEDGVDAGAYLTYNPGFRPPEMISTPSLPNEVFRSLDALIDEMDRIAGISELQKQSASPSPYFSGSALQELARASDTRIGGEAEQINFATIDICKKWLRLYHECAGMMRYMRLSDSASELGDAIAFKGSEITAFDVQPDLEDPTADTLAARKDNLIKLLQFFPSAMLNPVTGVPLPNAVRLVLETLEIGKEKDWEAIASSSQAVDDYYQAELAKQQEQAAASGGQVPGMMPANDIRYYPSVGS